MFCDPLILCLALLDSTCRHQNLARLFNIGKGMHQGLKSLPAELQENQLFRATQFESQKESEQIFGLLHLAKALVHESQLSEKERSQLGFGETFYLSESDPERSIWALPALQAYFQAYYDFEAEIAFHPGLQGVFFDNGISTYDIAYAFVAALENAELCAYGTPYSLLGIQQAISSRLLKKYYGEQEVGKTFRTGKQSFLIFQN